MKTQICAELKNISKTYKTENRSTGEVFITEALSGVSINFFTSEIHAILGENGAGKSTLVNIFSGLVTPDCGELKINGAPFTFNSPHDALKNGIGIVHQEPLLAYNAKVIENIMIGFKYFKSDKGNFFTGIKNTKLKLEALKKKWRTELDLNEKIKNLTPDKKFYTALFSVLCRKVNFLILDEPASVFTGKNREHFFKTLQKTALENSIGVILITHKFKDALLYTDKISILKKGKLENTFVTHELRKKEDTEFFLKDIIFGKLISKKNNNFSAEHRNIKPSTQIKHLKNQDSQIGFEFNITVTVNSQKKNFNVSAKKGYITGVAGFLNSGIEHIEEILSGMSFFSSPLLQHTNYKNFICINTESKTLKLFCNKIKPAILLKHKIGFIPSDRILRASNPKLTIEEIMNSYRFKDFLFNKKVSSEFIQKILYDENINADKNRLVSTLSGGQLQRLILARCLLENPEIIIACEPMHGLDVLSTELLSNKFRNFTETGKTLIVMTKEFDTIAYKNFFDYVYFLGNEN